MTRKIKAFVAGAVGLVAFATIVIWSGAYNVAATVPHFGLTEWLFTQVRDQSIAMRADTIRVPADLRGRLQRERAVRSFHDMCVGCHAAPGLEPSAIREGLNPKPPKLTAERVQARDDAELFWIISNGIKMTGMPAFGPTHEDDAIWELVSFVRVLAELEPEEYKALLARAGITLEKTSGHEHNRSHPDTQDPKHEQRT